MSTSTDTSASDLVRFHFHLITEHGITAKECTRCWTDVVFLLSEVATPAEILAQPHVCTAVSNSSSLLAKELTAHPEKW